MKKQRTIKFWIFWWVDELTWYFWKIVSKNWYVLTDTFCDPDKKKPDKIQENKKTSKTKTDTFYFCTQKPSKGQFF